MRSAYSSSGVREELAAPRERVRALRVAPPRVGTGPDPEPRYPDFAKLMMRIATGLGEHFPDLATRAIQGIRASHGGFALDDDEIAMLLNLWIDNHAPSVNGQSSLGPLANDGRRVLRTELFAGLKTLSGGLGMKISRQNSHLACRALSALVLASAGTTSLALLARSALMLAKRLK